MQVNPIHRVQEKNRCIDAIERCFLTCCFGMCDTCFQVKRKLSVSSNNGS